MLWQNVAKEVARILAAVAVVLPTMLGLRTVGDQCAKEVTGVLVALALKLFGS